MDNKNTKILAIDYGKSKVGLAISEGSLAEPLRVIQYEDIEDLVRRIKIEVEKEKVDRIVVGVSEGQMAEKTRGFRGRLEKEINIPIEEFDETLTSQDAQKLSIEAGISRKKRQGMEDAFAAAVILQNYMDEPK